MSKPVNDHEQDRPAATPKEPGLPRSARIGLLLTALAILVSVTLLVSGLLGGHRPVFEHGAGDGSTPSGQVRS